MKSHFQIKNILFVLSMLVFQYASPQFLFNHYTVNEGLVSNEVTCTYRDSRGFLWIGTTQGLQVYNGKYFKTLRHHLLDSNSISGDWIMSIAEDANGMIWIGTDKGICKIHPGHLRCMRYAPGQKMQANVKDQFSSVIADQQGKIWALSTNFLLEFKNDSFLCANPVSYHGRMSWGKNNDLLIVTGNNLFIKNTKTGEWKEIKTGLETNIHFTTIYMDSNGFYWMGTWGNGLYRFTNNWKTYWQYKWDTDPVNPSTTNIVSDITGNKENVFVSTTKGLYIYRSSKELDLAVYDLLQYNPNEQHGLLAGEVNDVNIDAFDNIWVSTSSGLNVSLVLNREYKSMVSETGFATDVAWRNGQLISSSWYGKGLYFFDDKMHLVKNVQYVPEYMNELNNSQVSGIDMDLKGNLWVASFNGLSYYDVKNKKTMTYYSKQTHGFATNRLNDVWFNKTENEVWTANYDAGITRYHLSSGKVTNLNRQNSQFMINDLVWSFYDTGDGNVWILANSGALVYNYNKHTWNSYTGIDYNGIKIPLGIVQTALKDKNGFVWLGTQNGLFINYNNKWVFKGIENGLPERSVNSVVQDREGNIWIGFDHSIVCYHSQTSVTSVLSSSNGVLLPYIQFLFLNPVTDQLYIASENCYYEVYKDKLLQLHTQSPQVFLETFTVNGKSYYSSTSNFSIEKNSFSYNKNNVEISFVTPSIGEVGKLQYSYRIGSGSWSFPSDNNSIILPRLQQGNYKVEIKATTDGTHWSQQPLLVTFSIHPPFWGTFWFRILMMMLVLSGIIWWVRYISTRKMRIKIIELEKEQAIEKERSRLSRDMHDDLGSGLTKISILSEVVKKKMGSHEKVEPYLENISDSSRELVQSLNNIIWSLNTGNATVQALLAYIREYASQFLDSCQVEFTFGSDHFTTNKTVSEQVKRNLFLVVKEVLNNAVKHGHAKSIDVKIEHADEESIHIIIMDNGKGFDPSMAIRGNGLKNMKKRMLEMEGNLIIESEKEKGTKVQLICRI